MKEKALNFLKKYKYYAIGVIVLLAVIITIVCIVASNGKSDESDAKWGDGLSKGIPHFIGRGEVVTSGDGYIAAYYNDVSSESIEEYVLKLESTLKIDFEGEKFPRTAIYGGKIITLHYNVTEMKFSVTVTTNN